MMAVGPMRSRRGGAPIAVALVLLLLAFLAAVAAASSSSIGARLPVAPVDAARRRAQQQGSSSSRLAHRRRHHHHHHHANTLPVAMLGGIVEGIGNSLRRLREGTADLMGNAKQLGSLKKRWHSGEGLTFEEYNLMQRTSGDLAKFVGLALFTLSKPEFTPFLCSFFPQVVPSTYLSSDEKLQRAQQKNFQRVRSVVQHLMTLQQEAVAPHRKETERMRHLKTMEGILKARGKGTDAALKEAAAARAGALFTDKTADRKGRPRADLSQVPRPFLVSVAHSIGMWNRFVPAAALRAMLRDYTFKIAESDGVLLRTNVDKLGRDDLVDACGQRALSLGDATEAGMRANLKAYLKTVSKSGLAPPKAAATAEAAPVALNENNLRFALLGLNMVGLVRDAKENSGLRALFGV